MKNVFSQFIGLAWLCPLFTAVGQSNARTMQGAIFEKRNVSGLS
ncbi:hypothetical protein CLV98_102497 [Dyadobacter jejuensis]|uniref:Uncharacterized protein n=1 Tax=Dyadobacter jejuensis TaxID=1082580 RepID=A0A316APM1_9BACT|nr:hypothetical protein CLV98_102497 [Dyadobacter jejuensis]